MLTFNQEPSIDKSAMRTTTFEDENESFDISHKTIGASMLYVCNDVLSHSFDNINFSTLDCIDHINNDLMYDKIVKSADYIKTIAANAISRNRVLSAEEVDKMIQYYHNNKNRKYTYSVNDLKRNYYVDRDLKQIDRYITQLSTVYYIGESKAEQNDIIANMFNYINDELYSNKSFYDHYNNCLSGISFGVDRSTSMPFDNENDLKLLLSGNIESLVNYLNPFVKQLYQSKTFTDIIKGKIAIGRSEIETAIVFAYFILLYTIEMYIKNISEALNVAENMYEGYLDPNHPIYCIENTSSDMCDVSKSFEAVNGEKNINVDDTYKKKSEELYKIYVSTVKLAKYNIGRFFSSMFFKKYYGRIPSLYERYGSEAKLAENKPNGDPTKILKEDGVKYIQDMTKDATDLFQEIINMANKVASSNDFNAKLAVVKQYCKRFPIKNDEDYKVIDDCIKKETLHRIATSILRDIKIYGYTVEGIVENGKFPPANHIVVSIFVDNPHEKPEMMAVTDIFTSPDNITIYAKPDLGNFFNDVYKKTSNLIMSGLNVKGITNTSNILEKSVNDYKMNIRKGIKDGSIDKEKLNGDKSGVKMINKGLEQSIELVWGQKRRCMQCISVMLDMTGRIILLAKKCVITMLNVEKGMKDERHNVGFKGENVNKTHKSVSKNVNAGVKEVNGDENISR